VSETLRRYLRGVVYGDQTDCAVRSLVPDAEWPGPLVWPADPAPDSGPARDEFSRRATHAHRLYNADSYDDAPDAVKWPNPVVIEVTAAHVEG